MKILENKLNHTPFFKGMTIKVWYNIGVNEKEIDKGVDYENILYRNKYWQFASRNKRV